MCHFNNNSHDIKSAVWVLLSAPRDTVLFGTLLSSVDSTVGARVDVFSGRQTILLLSSEDSISSRLNIDIFIKSNQITLFSKNDTKVILIYNMEVGLAWSPGRNIAVFSRQHRLLPIFYYFFSKLLYSVQHTAITAQK